MIGFSGREMLQNKDEWASLIEIIKTQNVRRILEIGSRFGDSLHAMGMAMEPGGLLTSVDLPLIKPNFPHPTEMLIRAADDLIAQKDHEVHILQADSTKAETIERAETYAPYDLCFIDGDHSLPTVTQDWQNYRGMARIVAFHDITPIRLNPKKATIDVPILWKQILAEGHQVSELVRQKAGYGIGVVWQ